TAASTRRREWDSDPAGADTELHYGPPRAARLLEVEPDVLDDARAPGVVELRYRVVSAQWLDSPPMDWQEYEDTALRSFAEAGSAEQLADAHTDALGRRSELKVELRNVRDRETGITLNAGRDALAGGVAS